MSQVFGFALQRVALFVTLYCVDVGEGVRECVCVCDDMKERERGTHSGRGWEEGVCTQGLGFWCSLED